MNCINHPCIGFTMENAAEALSHMDKELVEDYGGFCNDHYLYIGDDGKRLLYKCKRCGGFILAQCYEVFGEFDDEYFVDYFPVSGQEEAADLNERYDGHQIKELFAGKYITLDNYMNAYWSSSPSNEMSSN